MRLKSEEAMGSGEEALAIGQSHEHLAIREKKKPEDPIDLNDLKSMRFTRAVIFETSRLATIVNGVLRKTTKDMELNGDMAANQTNRNTGFFNVGTMLVPLPGDGANLTDTINGAVGRTNVTPLNLFPETVGHVGETSTPTTIVGHFTLPVASEGIIRLTTTQYTAKQEQMQALQLEVNGRVRTRRPPRVSYTHSGNPRVTTTNKRQNERLNNNRVRRERKNEQEGLDLNQPTHNSMWNRELVASNTGCGREECWNIILPGS
ncbi:hypothetical protein CsatB_030069 [Cannabis sativa]